MSTPGQRLSLNRRASVLKSPAAVVALFLCVVACSAATQLPAPVSYTQPCTAGTCTGTFPTVFDAGMQLAYVNSFRVKACAWAAAAGNVGQQFQGAGTFNAVLGDSLVQLPLRNTGLDQTVTASGVNCITFPDFTVGTVSPEPHFVFFYPSGVTVNGVDGGPLTIYIEPHRGQ